MPDPDGLVQTHAPNEAAVVGKAVLRAADRLGLRNAALADVLGLSEATMSRLKSGDYSLDRNPKAYELALLVIRLFRGLDAIVGGDTTAVRSWMGTENRALHGEPISLIKTITGLALAVQYVDAQRARI